MRDATERLRDILEAIDRIQAKAPATREDLARDELTQVWVVHHLRIIGEAVRALPEDVRARAPDAPWPQIIGMRHILVHQYFEIDVATVWAVIERDLAPLRAIVVRLLAAPAPGA